MTFEKSLLSLQRIHYVKIFKMSIRKVKLKEIAEITSGYSFRTKIQNDPKGDTYAIQMRDISEDRTKIIAVPHMVDGSKIHEKHLLKKGDLLFMAKGANNFAVCYDINFKPAVAASAFFIIRIKISELLPAYLCLYINSEMGQNYLQANMAGTYIPNINKSTLIDMEINIPTIENQEKLIKLFQTFKKEKQIISDIIMKKEIVVNEMIKKIIKLK